MIQESGGGEVLIDRLLPNEELPTPPRQQQQRALAWKPLASHAQETGMQMLIAALFARANSKLKITQEFLK